MAKGKISIVKYLNAVPLAWGILEGPQREVFDPILSTPVECAEQLAQGRVDIGLIPSIEFQRIKGCRIVPGPAVAATHRVRSVILISVVPLWKVRTVACDSGSMTADAFAQIMLSEVYHTRTLFQASAADSGNILALNRAAFALRQQYLK